MIIWLIGLSGAGKSTVGQALTEALRKNSGESVVYLDGDELRDIWGDSLGHTVEERNQNAHRISHLCQMLDKNGVTAVATVLSIFPDWQQWNRKKFSAYFEIFLDVPMEILEARDSKGLYTAFAKGEIANVVGKDIPFPTPANPDLIIDNGLGQAGPGAIVQTILEAIESRLLRPPNKRGWRNDQ